MGNAMFRNRFWYYRSMYDDYWLRESRFAFAIAGVIWIPTYCWGMHMNREIENHWAHRHYTHEWGPRRNRLTHSLLFEEFEVVLEKWTDLEKEYKVKGKKLLDEIH